jgi:tetratricopeptide (TPR) repeat protein
VPISVFISYAHEDEELKNELLKHLALLRNEGVIATWDDRALIAGSSFDSEIEKQLETADLILLLISADFINSEYCWSIEMKRAVQRHEAKTARVIPVILRAVDWHTAPFGKLTAAPTDGKPVTSWSNRDEALLDVAQHIRRAVTELKPRSSSSRKISNAAPPNPNFTGREPLLASLRESLTREGNAAIVQAISGMGGVGKSQLALMYAHRHADDYDIVWWIRAEQSTTIASDLAALATPLGLPERDLADQSAIVEAVRRALRERKRWLLIFDNAERSEDVQPYLPLAGHVIITSRNPAWGRFGKPIEVHVLPREEAVRFLVTRTGQEAGAEGVAKALGDLPLALEQAGAYVERTAVSLDEYLEIFNTRRAELWKREATIAETTVATTLNLSVQKLDATAIELLKFYAFLAPDDIPRTLLDGIGAELLTEGLAEIAADKLKRNDAIAALRQYSLVSTHGDVCDVHRLLQLVVRDTFSDEESKFWPEMVAVVVERVSPHPAESDRWNELDVLMPHMREIVDHCKHAGVATFVAGNLLTAMAGYRAMRGDYDSALAARRECVAIAELAYGRSDPRVATARANVGAALADIGDIDTAIRELDAALAICLDSVGEEDAQTAHVLGLLGYVYGQARQYAKSFEVLSKATEIGKRLGMYDSRPGWITNLGLALLEIGRPAEGLKYMEEAIALREQLHGADSAEMSASLHNLAIAAMRAGEHGAADRHFNRALQIAEKTFGVHPNTGRTQLVYAALRVLRGDVARAKELAEQGIASFQKGPAPASRELAERVESLADVLDQRGHRELADVYRKRARAWRRA